MIILGICLVVLALIIIYTVSMYNVFIKLNNKVKEAFSTMDVYMKKRWDLIPNIVETVKGYAKHEKETLEEIVELRNNMYDKMSSDEKIRANDELSKGINKLFAVAENYPDLKASENFKNLSNELSQVEEDIANSRKYYNGVVRMFNDKVLVFPNNIFAGLFGFREKTMFLVDEKERENVKVEF